MDLPVVMLITFSRFLLQIVPVINRNFHYLSFLIGEYAGYYEQQEDGERYCGVLG